MVAQIRSWRHSGFSIDRSVHLPTGDAEGIERLTQYMVRCPFSLARVVRFIRAGKVVYRAETQRPLRFSETASVDLFGTTARNFQILGTLDLLPELIQHIPNNGEHIIRYYGHYSNKARAIRAEQAGSNQASSAPHQLGHTSPEKQQPTIAPSTQLERRRWAMLIKQFSNQTRCSALPAAGQ